MLPATSERLNLSDVAFFMQNTDYQYFKKTKHLEEQPKKPAIKTRLKYPIIPVVYPHVPSAQPLQSYAK